MKQITVHKVGGAHPISWRSYKGKTEVPQWFWPGVPQEIVISQPELPLSHNLTRTDGFAPKVLYHMAAKMALVLGRSPLYSLRADPSTRLLHCPHGLTVTSPR